MEKKKSISGKLSLDDKIYLTENLAIMLKSGVSISEALSILETQSKGKIKNVVHGIVDGVNSGQKLSECFGKYKNIFSTFFINSVMSGESSGNLENNLNDLAIFLKKEKDLRDKVRSAMVYPVIILILGFLIATMVSFFVLPKITPIFRGLKVDLPLSTRALMYVAEMVEKHGILLLLGIIFGVLLINFVLHRKSLRPLTHAFILRIPIMSKVSIYRNIAIACHTLSTMLKSGLSLIEAIEITSETVSNYYYKKYLLKVRTKLNEGLKFSTSMDMDSRFFPKMIIGLINVGERSGNLENELFNIGEIYEKKVENATKNLATTLEPLLLVFIGLGVGWLALSIITPIYEITGNISN